MGGDLVEEDEGRKPAHRRDEPGMGEDEADRAGPSARRSSHGRPGCPSGRGARRGRRPAARRACARRRGRARGRRAGARGSGPPHRPRQGRATSRSTSPSSAIVGEGERARRRPACREMRSREALHGLAAGGGDGDASSAISRSIGVEPPRVLGASPRGSGCASAAPVRARSTRAPCSDRPQGRAGRGSGGGRRPGRETARRDPASARRRADVR